MSPAIRKSGRLRTVLDRRIPRDLECPEGVSVLRRRIEAQWIRLS